MCYFKTVFPFLISVACVTLSGCHSDKEETPAEPETLITLEIDPSFVLISEAWVYATDETGEVLDVGRYYTGQTTKLSSIKPVDKVNLTFFQRYEKTHFTRIHTYAAVPKGSMLRFVGSSEGGDTDASASIVLSNVKDDPGATLNMSNAYPDWTKVGDDWHANFSFYHDIPDLLVIAYRDDVPVYNWIKDLHNGDEVTRDFLADFHPFPHLLNLDFEGANRGNIYGYYSGKRSGPGGVMLVDDILNTTYTPTPVLGYVEGFDSYSTTIYNQKENGTVTYYKNGSPVTKLTIPTFTFSLIKKDKDGLDFNFSEDYHFLTSTWAYTVGLERANCEITAPKGAVVKGPVIPKEIQTFYADLPLNNLSPAGIELFQNIQGYTYQDLLSEAFGNPRAASEYYIFAPEY